MACANSASTLLSETPFMRACKLLSTDYTPIWLMRQAGRFMPEYRKIREKVDFLTLCKTPDLAAEVTVMAVEKLNVDAAIIFADILLILEPLGVGLKFVQGDGPLIERPVRSPDDLKHLKEIDAETALSFVSEAIKKTRAHLPPNIPLIGFAGAPFTLASYLIEGGSTRQFALTKTFMYNHPQAWAKLMDLLSIATIEYLSQQIKAGAQAVQIFDSWVGYLSPDDYRQYVLPSLQKIIASLAREAPFINFGAGTGGLLALTKQAGANIISLDWRMDLSRAWNELGDNFAVQGNLDPIVLLAEPKEIKNQATKILIKAAGRAGHIFNLGHGILPQTPVDNVRYLVDTVHSFGVT
jgi:uroporphyrinogen decarboxylase